MARRPRRGLLGIVFMVLIVVVAGGYFAMRSTTRGEAGGSDSLDVSSAAHADSASKGHKKNGDDKDKKKEPAPVPVEIATVDPREISSYYYTTASLEPERKVSIIAKIAGEVVELRVEEGALVKPGQILCRIDDNELRIALEEARINRDRQQREFDRFETMFKEKIVSDKEFSEAKYQYELMVTQYDAAALRYQHAKVRAPFGGVITKRFVELGQNLNIGTEIFELVDVDPLLVRMYLPEGEIRAIHVGQAVTIAPDGSPNVTLTGRIIRIAPEVDRRTGTIKVTAETHGRAMPGSFARIKVVTDTREGTLAIPRRSLVSDAGELYVYVAEADTVRKARVHIGFEDEQFAEVLDGVAHGDSVVVVGTGGIRTGTKIKVLKPTLQGELTRTASDDSASN